MRKVLLIPALLSLCLAMAPQKADAIMIDVDPAAQQADLGNQVSVDLVISDLGLFSAPSVGVFDIDVDFDSSILSFVSATFGTELDLFGFGSIQDVNDFGTGTVNLFELSFDFPDDLDTLQADSFVLASLTFDTLAAGTSPVALTLNDLGDSLGDPLSAGLVNGAVEVVRQDVQVPLPPSLPLMLIGLLGLGVAVRKSRVRQDELR